MLSNQKHEQGFILIAILTMAAIISLFVIHMLDETFICEKIAKNFHQHAQIEDVLVNTFAAAKNSIKLNAAKNYSPLCEGKFCGFEELLQKTVVWNSVTFDDFNGKAYYNIQKISRDSLMFI